VKFKSGAVANLWGCCATYVAPRISLSLDAPETSVRFLDWDHSVEIVRPNQEPLIVDGKPAAGEILTVEDRAFLDALRSGDSSLIKTDYADALKTLELTVAASASATEEGAPRALRF
jgi:hypothetical protein